MEDVIYIVNAEGEDLANITNKITGAFVGRATPGQNATVIKPFVYLSRYTTSSNWLILLFMSC